MSENASKENISKKIAKKKIFFSKKERPEIEQIDKEIGRREKLSKFKHSIFVVIYALIVVAAVALIVATTIVKVIRVYGTSMEPTLNQREIVIGVTNSSYQRGDLVAFYLNNKVLIKRVIGVPGDTIDIDINGNVAVNGEILEEDYVTELSKGFCDVNFPVHVADNELFVLGDNRETALDSRAKEIGNVNYEDIVCKLVFRIWPFDGFGGL